MFNRYSGYLAFFLICVLGLSIIDMYVKGQLAHYIHPSTIILTAAAGTLLVLAGLLAVAQPHLVHHHLGPGALALVLCLVLGLAIIKTTPLSSTMAQKRPADQSVVTASRTSLNLNKLSSHFSLLDWQQAWQSDPGHLQFKDKPVKVDGFIMVDNTTTYVARLLLTCCVVDARPIKIELKATSTALPPADTWVTITGTMTGQELPVIAVETITPIAAPANPYVY